MVDSSKSREFHTRHEPRWSRKTSFRCPGSSRGKVVENKEDSRFSVTWETIAVTSCKFESESGGCGLDSPPNYSITVSYRASWISLSSWKTLSGCMNVRVCRLTSPIPTCDGSFRDIYHSTRSRTVTVPRDLGVDRDG